MRYPTELGLTRLAYRVARDYGRELPEVTWEYPVEGQPMHAHTHEDGITMPSRAWAMEYRATDPLGYKLLLLHEMAHWLKPYQMENGETWFEDHTPEFYALLYELCLDYGVKLSHAYEDEIRYMPVGARRGFDLFIQRLAA